MAGDLLYVACKYNIETLSAICESHLFQIITIDTAVDMLILADTLGLSEMKGNIMR